MARKLDAVESHGPRSGEEERKRLPVKSRKKNTGIPFPRTASEFVGIMSVAVNELLDGDFSWGFFAPADTFATIVLIVVAADGG
mgnify:FL=1